MRLLRSPLIKVLCFVVLVSLLSGLVVSAAPDGRAGAVNVRIACKPAQQAHDSADKPGVQPSVNCCVQGKISAAAGVDKKVGSLEASVDPCCIPLKIMHGVRGRVFIPDPCEEPPPPDPTCGIAYTADAVVGDLPFDTQAYWAPGKVAAKVTVNAGTYWVLGIGTAENGDEYYQIIVACQKLFVPVGSMQPSYQPPWHGEPLPTTPIE